MGSPLRGACPGCLGSTRCWVCADTDLDGDCRSCRGTQRCRYCIPAAEYPQDVPPPTRPGDRAPARDRVD